MTKRRTISVCGTCCGDWRCDCGYGAGNGARVYPDSPFFPLPYVGMRKRNAKGWVYAIRAPHDGTVKIGFSRNPYRRFADIQNVRRDWLELVGTIPGGYMDEKAIHRRFADALIEHEWFRETPAVARWLTVLRRRALVAREKVRMVA